MMKIFKSNNNELVQCESITEGVWIDLVNPSAEEVTHVSNTLNVDSDFLKSALDEEERARIESEDGNTLILVDIPVTEDEGYLGLYTTIPLAIILTRNTIITVCLRENTILYDFRGNKVKSFLTHYMTRFVLLILYRNSKKYLQDLKQIDKASNRIEQELHQSLKNKELIQMLKLEKSLVYFSTALKSNEIVLEKLMKFEYIKNYQEDAELLEDVIIENKQAIEMANIYSSILTGTMDAFASVISNNLNIVMKFLSSVTIVMAIPTMIASFFGMNVTMPLKSPHAFWIIMAVSVIISLIAGIVLYRKKMF